MKYYFDKKLEEKLTGYTAVCYINRFIRGEAKQIISVLHIFKGNYKRQIPKRIKEELKNIIREKISKIKPGTVTETFDDWKKAKINPEPLG